MFKQRLPILFISVLTALWPSVSVGDVASPSGQALSYRLEPRQPLKYRLIADIKGRMPIADSTEPADITAKLTFTYTATPKTRLSDGTSDVDFRVGAVDLEILKIPFSVPDEDARKVLNLTVTFARTGEAIKVLNSDQDLPFSVSVPGVDPKRLYALIFPVVFQKTPISEGVSWSYKSDLLGGHGTTPRFTATLLSPDKGTAKSTARLKQAFEMGVDSKVDVDKKPVSKPEDAHRIKSGKIVGEGIYQFDKLKGRVTRGEVMMRANITDRLVGKPLAEDEPAALVSAIEAKLTIELLSADKRAADGSASTATRTQTLAASKREKP